MTEPVKLEVTGEGSRLNFVAEKKGSPSADDLRDTERAKIACGEKHFKAFDSGTRYVVEHTVEELLAAHAAG